MADLMFDKTFGDGLAASAQQFVKLHKPDPILCLECGMPDVREVVRETGRGGRWGSVEFVDLICLDCSHVQVDTDGGV